MSNHQPTVKNYIALNEIRGNEPTSLSGAQPFLVDNLQIITLFYWFVWVTVLVNLVLRFIILPLLQQADQTSGEKKQDN